MGGKRSDFCSGGVSQSVPDPRTRGSVVHESASGIVGGFGFGARTFVLSLRYAGLAQTFNRALTPRQIDGIVARSTVTEAADCEGWIEREIPPQPPPAHHPTCRVAPKKRQDKNARWNNFG